MSLLQQKQFYYCKHYSTHIKVKSHEKKFCRLFSQYNIGSLVNRVDNLIETEHALGWNVWNKSEWGALKMILMLWYRSSIVKLRFLEEMADVVT